MIGSPQVSCILISRSQWYQMVYGEFVGFPNPVMAAGTITTGSAKVVAWSSRSRY